MQGIANTAISDHTKGRKLMRLGKDLTGKPIISVTDGRLVGYAKDLYVNKDLYWVTGIYTGSEGLIGRKDKLVGFADRLHACYPRRKPLVCSR